MTKEQEAILYLAEQIDDRFNTHDYGCKEDVTKILRRNSVEVKKTCKECNCTVFTTDDKSPGIYHCIECGYPNTLEDMWDTDCEGVNDNDRV